MKKAIIFGASVCGKTAYIAMKSQYDVICFCDNNKLIWGEKIEGLEVISPERLLEIKHDVIIVASQYKNEIVEQLKTINIDSEIMYFNFELKNQIELIWESDKDEIFKYVSGSKLNIGLDMNFDSATKYESREHVLENIVKNKKIIHLGCCDHPDVIEEKIKSNCWLHSRLENVAQKLLGVDVNKEALSIANKYRTNIIEANIIEDNISGILEEKWDMILIPDVLEHISNPVEFLKIIRDKYTNIDEIVISVPNAFGFMSIEAAAIEGIERINTDHRYWFTPYTLLKVMYEAGFEVNKLILCGKKSEKSIIKSKGITMMHIVATAKFK